LGKKETKRGALREDYSGPTENRCKKNTKKPSTGKIGKEAVPKNAYARNERERWKRRKISKGSGHHHVLWVDHLNTSKTN